MSGSAEAKAADRTRARARRQEAARAGGAAAAEAAGLHVVTMLDRRPRGFEFAGYLPIGDEIDPRPAMRSLHARGAHLCVPVIEAAGAPLRFRRWTPDARVVSGRFGIAVPAEGEWVQPRVLLVPLLAFDGAGHRLGYGGGYYDRTIAALRAAGPVTALGFAFAAQQVASVPTEPTDAPLDAVVTEHGVLVPSGEQALRLAGRSDPG